MRLKRRRNWAPAALAACIVTFSLACRTPPGFADRIPAVERTQFVDHGDDWRNLRYGEVIPVWKSGLSLYMEVYNTVASNELPQELWAALDAEALATEFGAYRVILNGPRYWVIDGIRGGGDTASGKVADFGGIEMTQRATLRNSVVGGAIGSEFYSERSVKRDTAYTYRRGRLVYELANAKGEVYRMQSYSTIIDPGLTIEALENLGPRLRLPEGWSYSARLLDAESILVSNGMAIVVNDELGNTYQKVVDRGP